MEGLNTSVSNLTQTCESAYDGKIYLDEPMKIILLSVLAVSAILNLFSSAFVIYALITTQQLGNPSMRLILCLSVSDCCLAAFGQPLYLIMLSNFSTGFNCQLDTTVEFFVILLSHTSAYIIGLIGYDRYFRMKYLNLYAEVVKDWKVYVAIVTTIAFSFLQTCFQITGIQLNIYHTVTIGTCTIDFIIIIWMIIPYLLSVRVIREHRKSLANHWMLAKVDHTITTLATRIMISIMVLYFPYVSFTVVHISLNRSSSLTKRKWFNFGVFVSYQLAMLNAFVHAAIFINFNTKSRRKLVELFVRLLNMNSKKIENSSSESNMCVARRLVDVEMAVI